MASSPGLDGDGLLMATRSTKRTPKKERKDWKPIWLEAFKDKGTVTAACEVARVSRSTVYDARTDDSFATAWDAIEHMTTEDLEQEAIRRAKDGSDTLLIFMLKSRKPETYRERYEVKHEGKIDTSGPDLSNLSDKELEQWEALQRKASGA